MACDGAVGVVDYLEVLIGTMVEPGFWFRGGKIKRHHLK